VPPSSPEKPTVAVAATVSFWSALVAGTG
jgi:hypothetical protein